MMALGNAYESRVLRHISLAGVELAPRLYKRQWIGYEEPPGRLHAAQPDLFVLLSNTCVVFEIKLSRCEEGFAQLERLYFPLLWQLFRLPLAGVCVFRNPGKEYLPFPSRPRSLREALTTPAGYISEWHLLV